MIFIVARTWACASRVARREGLTDDQWLAWIPVVGYAHKIRGLEDPKIWIADCGSEILTEEDRDLIRSRYRTPGAGPSRVTCP